MHSFDVVHWNSPSVHCVDTGVVTVVDFDGDVVVTDVDVLCVVVVVVLAVLVDVLGDESCDNVSCLAFCVDVSCVEVSLLILDGVDEGDGVVLSMELTESTELAIVLIVDVDVDVDVGVGVSVDVGVVVELMFTMLVALLSMELMASPLQVTIKMMAKNK